MAKTEELKACAHCGGEAELQSRHEFNVDESGDGYDEAYAVCVACGIQTSHVGEIDEEAISAWNTRFDRILYTKLTRPKKPRFRPDFSFSEPSLRKGGSR